MSLGKNRLGDKMKSGLEAQSKGGAHLLPDVNWTMECVRKGKVVWTEKFHNLVTHSGTKYLLDILANTATIKTPWRVGLIQCGLTVANADTMSSHAGWDDFSNYSESAHQLWVGAAADAQGASNSFETTNSASKAAFTIRGASTTSVGGAFLAETATMSGNVGIIYAAGQFDGGNRTGLQPADTLNVTATMSAITG